MGVVAMRVVAVGVVAMRVVAMRVVAVGVVAMGVVAVWTMTDMWPGPLITLEVPLTVCIVSTGGSQITRRAYSTSIRRVLVAVSRLAVGRGRTGASNTYMAVGVVAVGVVAMRVVAVRVVAVGVVAMGVVAVWKGAHVIDALKITGAILVAVETLFVHLSCSDLTSANKTVGIHVPDKGVAYQISQIRR
jgi:hypothetical protein